MTFSFAPRPVHFALAVLALWLLINSIAQAQQGDADVTFVRAIDHGEPGWAFHVTVEHADTGWEDYCNGWDVLTDTGVVLKHNESDPFTRLLFHPHENEQPFTRSESRLQVPEGTKSLTVRAHDIVDGFGGKEIVIDLASQSGAGYEISRQ